MNKNLKLLLFDLGLWVASIALSSTLGQGFKNANPDFLGTLAGVTTLLLIGMSSVFLGVTGSVVSFFSPNFNRLALSFLVSGLAFFVFLSGLGNVFVRLGLAMLFVLALFVFAAFVRTENENILRFSVRKIFLPSLQKLGVSVILIFCTGFFFSYRSLVEQEGFKAPATLIDKVVELTGQSIIDTLTREIASTSKLPNQQAVFVEIPEELGEAGLTKTLKEEFGIEIDRVPQSSKDLMNMIRPALRQKISWQLEEAFAPHAELIPPLVSLLLFLTLLPGATVGALLALPPLALVFKVLQALELIKEKAETITIHRYTLQD